MRPSSRCRKTLIRGRMLALIASVILIGRGTSQRVSAAPPPRFDPKLPSAVTSEGFRNYLNGLRFSQDAGSSDQQRLLVGSYPSGHYGPLATIQAESTTVTLTLAQLDSGRVIGRILNQDPDSYPKFGFMPHSVTYWWVDRRGKDTTGWRSVMISMDSASRRVLNISERALIVETHYEYLYQRALARFLWSDRDEQLWVSCTSSGCCKAQE